MSFAKGSYVFIPDPEDMFLAAKVETEFAPGKAGAVKLVESGRSVKLTSKGTTQLDRIIDNAKRLPGPGDYNLSNDATHKPGSMEAYLLGESDTMF